MKQEILRYFSRLSEEEQEILQKKRVDEAAYFSEGSFVVDKAKLLAGGQYISVRPHPRFVFFPAHSHNYVEIVYMLAGSTTHLINGTEEIVLRTGELLMMNQHVAHAIQPAGEADIAVNFLVLPQFFDTALELIGADNPLGRFLLGGLQKDGGDISYLHFRTADIPATQNLIENLLLGFLHPGQGEAYLARNTMGLLFLHLLHHTDVMRADSGEKGRNALMVKCLQEVEEHYMSANLAAIANAHGVSSAYLSALVKNTTGQNFKALLQEKRLVKAETLLRQTDLNINDIIAAVGYQNTSHFYRLFKRRFGVTPGELRKS
ncbi:AraC family transcriptional regulator [Christensenellaceae bacterium OttesenSCG-928-L17]|nr:AraC family transcriptional regulator [Christensenellaceae bacterium OttesenSCG-928-L17]